MIIMIYALPGLVYLWLFLNLSTTLKSKPYDLLVHPCYTHVHLHALSALKPQNF